jgi:hypothetical protein
MRERDERWPRRCLREGETSSVRIAATSADDLLPAASVGLASGHAVGSKMQLRKSANFVFLIDGPTLFDRCI